MISHNGYVEITVEPGSSEKSDIIIALLADAGYYGFTETEEQLTAYIEVDAFNEGVLKELASGFDFLYKQQYIPEQNWNETWEANFEPVVVDDLVAVRADFHEPVKGTRYEIVITPKMSFGTGHHATTYLMMQQMCCLDFRGRSVFDFGTGTGILAILAEKLGAGNVLAIDNDSWCIENSGENIQKNYCSRIELTLSEKPSTGGRFDIILANINKHIITVYLEQLKEMMNSNGVMLLSGLLTEDEHDILNLSRELHMKHAATFVKGRWICMELHM